MPLAVTVTGFNQAINPSNEQYNTTGVTNIDFSTFTRKDQIKKNVARAGSTPSYTAVAEARRIKREHNQLNIAANKTGTSFFQMSGGPLKQTT